MALSSSDLRKESYILDLDKPSVGWRPVGNMTEARGVHTCSLVDNKIVVVGGHDGSSTIDSVNIFNIATGKWKASKG